MAVSEAQEYDPFAAFDDVVAGTTRDPWPALAEKRRTDPVSKGMMISPDVLPEGFDPLRSGSPTATRTAPGFPRPQDVHLDGL